jgi:hypothetical protein
MTKLPALTVPQISSFLTSDPPNTKSLKPQKPEQKKGSFKVDYYEEEKKLNSRLCF